MQYYMWICHVLFILEAFEIKMVRGESVRNRNSCINMTTDATQSKKSIKILIKTLDTGPSNRAYSEWGQWSECSISDCTRNRQRICKVKHKCGDTVQTEEKSCRFPRVAGYNKIKCGRTKRKEIKDRKEVSPVSQDSNIQRKYKFKIIFNTPDSLERRILPSRSSKWYSKWSRWSVCSKACVTHRKRWCRQPKLCARNVIKETAYCYVEGSFCQTWIEKKIPSNQNNAKGQLVIDTLLEGLPNKDRNDIDTNVFRYGANRPQCGVLYSGSRNSSRKSMWSMTRIIGGRPSPRGKWPWQVAVLNRYKEAFCGGTLVSPNWVLSAAHCIRKRLYVRLGEYNLSTKDDMETEYRIIQMIVHPGYDSETVDNDVAMLRLPSYAKNLHLGVACLPRPKQPLPVNKLCTIIGWGKRKSTDAYGAELLHEAQVPIVMADECKNTYIDYYITSNMFCAGYKKGRMDSCAGDSGGPLLCRDSSTPGHPWTVFGITSFGDGCGKKRKYGIYTRLPNYVRWIIRVLKMSVR